MIFRLADGYESKVFEDYGLKPQYDLDTGKIFEYKVFTTDEDGYRDNHLIFTAKVVSVKESNIFGKIEKKIWVLEHLDDIGMITLYDMIKADIIIKEKEKND